ncbi:MAG: helix-turn-helix domain-containing protein [Firmicutes bacterium]|nr:helix-turn-helix domain-containing protein [Bacillota bacterium]
MDEYYKIGNFICEIRKRKGYSQAQLGDLVGVSNKAVSKWENGRGLPDTLLLLKLSEILEVSVDEILKGELFIPFLSETKQNETKEDIHSNIYLNLKVLYLQKKKLWIRDTILLMPMVFAVAFLLTIFILMKKGVQFSNLDYLESMMMWIVPLFVYGFFGLIYQVVIAIDIIKIKELSKSDKLMWIIITYFIISYAFYGIIIYRFVQFLKAKKHMKTKLDDLIFA